MRRCSFLRGRWPAVATLAVIFVCGALVVPGIATGLTPISGLSPYPDGGDPDDPIAVTECNGGPQGGVLYRNSETEPHIAVNPTNPDNMIAGWHQDRWSNGSAQGVMSSYTMDGGLTWTPVMIPFTRCSGGVPGTTGDWQRASDPWVTFGADGAAYYMALVTVRTTSQSAMVVAKSVDGGATWSDPVIIREHAAKGIRARSLFHDKNTMTADPFDPNFVYATWTLFRNGQLALLFSRSTDGGHTWEAARPVNKFDHIGDHVGVAFRQGSQIVVLPDGTLLNVFYRALFDPRHQGSFVALEQAIFRSRDRGKHWERLDTPVSWMWPTGAFDIELEIPVRDASQLPDIAVDPNNGYVYVVWQDGRFSRFGASSVLISRSTDGGSTWSAPVRVSHRTSDLDQAFLPAVAVAADGTVGVIYYDFRNDSFGDATLDTDVHLARLDSNLNLLGELRLTENSFDLRQMLLTGSRGYFPGDYVGLDAAGNDFVAAFTVANDLGLPVEFPQDPFELRVDNHNRQDIVFARVPASSADVSLGRPRGRGLEKHDGFEDAYVLHDNAPNPFNPTTSISFEIGRSGPVRLEIFDVSGRLVKTLAGGQHFPAGRNRVMWDGTNDDGQPVASGVYWYRLRADRFVATKRLTLMK